MQFYHNTLVQAPNLTAWKCDICGQSFYDARAVNQLNALIGAAGPPPNYHQTPSDDRQSPSSPDELTQIPHSRGTE